MRENVTLQQSLPPLEFPAGKTGNMLNTLSCNLQGNRLAVV